MRSRSGYCSHPECKGKGEQMIFQRNRMLCRKHNNERLNKNKPKKKFPTRKLTQKEYKPRTKVKFELDSIFSRYIRAMYSDTCYTCEENLASDCGHYMKRGNDATRWDEDNARPQCINCNRFNDGEQEIFRAKLLKEIGEYRLLEVERKSKLAVKFSKNDILDMTATYKQKIDSI